jgi:hypothetical protein
LQAIIGRKGRNGENDVGKRKEQASPKITKQQPEPQQGHPPVQRMTLGEAFEKLRRRANEGDPEARKALIQFFRSNPILWKKFGDLTDRAENAVIEAATGGEWLSTQATRHEAHELRKSLLGPCPSPLWAMAVDRLIAAGLLLQHVLLESLQPQRDHEMAKFWSKKLESTERMYRAALQSLELVRERLPSTVQSAIVKAELAREDDPVPPTKACEPAAERNGHVNGTGKINGHGEPISVNGQGINRIVGHAMANGKRRPNRLNGSRITGILETIGAVAEG